MFLAGLALGIFIGGCVGMLSCGLAITAARADRDIGS
jgi:hypothetical protein